MLHQRDYVVLKQRLYVLELRKEVAHVEEYYSIRKKVDDIIHAKLKSSEIVFFLIQMRILTPLKLKYLIQFTTMTLLSAKMTMTLNLEK